VEQENGVRRKRFAAERNDPWMNQHSIPVLLAWRSNMDLQPVVDREAAIKYVSKYASKPEVISQSYHDCLNDFCGRLPRDLPAEKAVQSLFAKMAADRDVSAQEAVHLLLSDKLVGCSRTFVNLTATTDAPFLLRDTSHLDADDRTFEETFFTHYENRPDELSHLNAVDYCKNYEIRKSSLPIISINNVISLTIFHVLLQPLMPHPAVVVDKLWCACGPE
jgi:hypothetical protein